MPSPHNSVSIISRNKGRSAVAAAAYRHATQMQDRGNKTNDYSKKTRELVHSEIALPTDVPAWARAAFGEAAFEAALAEVKAEAVLRGRELTESEMERAAWAKLSEKLWNSVEDGENRLNKFRDKAQVARSITIALPRQLSREAQIALMRGYVAAAFTSKGMIADWVLHDTGDGNPHVHIMLTMRDLGATDWGGKNRTWNATSLRLQQRKVWAEHANLALERAGFAERIDHRSLRAQELELAAEGYDPHVAAHAERVGERPREKMRCAEVRAQNQAYLRAHPDHILAVVQARRAVFGETHVRRAFAKRLGLDVEVRGGELDGLVAAAMGSRDLVRVVTGKEGDAPLYITVAKARMAQQVAADAQALSESRLALVAGGDGGEQALGAGDVIETGTGPVVVDIADWTGHDADAGGRDGALTGGDGDGGAGGRSGVRAGVSRGAAHAGGARADGARFAQGPSAAAVREALGHRAEDLFRSVFGEPVQPGAAEWRAKTNGAVAMQMRGPKRGLWSDHAAGTGGDLLDLIAREYCGYEKASQDFPAVLAEAARWCGMSAEDARPERAALDRLEARRTKREAQAALEAVRAVQRRAALVRELAGRAVPVAGFTSGSAAERYLASRGVTELPAEGVDYLGPMPDVRVLHPDMAALVVWARDESGAITGGQRILIAPDGSKADVEVRKPSFGSVGGSVARFAAREGKEDGPLVIAEGPESALSIWQETGQETWAVFGASNWRNAPVPVDREVIFAPDRDAPDSPAGRAFRKAVVHHLARLDAADAGGVLRIATAPEPVGSKRDLNDTLMRADGGAGAVRAAIAEARQVRPYLSARLNAGQRAAAEAMLSPERLTLVTGHAGVGKTFTLREAARVWQERGVPVLAGAPSGKATQELAGIAGVEAATLSAWEARWARGALPRTRTRAATGPGGPSDGFVFFMDEAGMVGAGQWSRLQAQIEAMGGKLIAVGDPEQLQPVMDLSGWGLAERAVVASGGTVPVMDLVIRQRDETDAQATAALAHCDEKSIRAGLRHYVETGA